MSDLSFSSSSDRITVSNELCTCTMEIDQAGKCTGDNAEFQNEVYCMELLHRATLQGDQNAWENLQELLDSTMRGWLAQHPRRAGASRLDIEENYVDQAFATFYLLAVRQHIEFSQFSTALHHLKVSLNSAILNKLRAFSQTQAIPLPASGGTSKQNIAESTDNVIVWKILQETFPNAREQRLAFLLFHCGLSPKKIVNFYPQEFQDVQEIFRLRHSIFELLLHRLDQLDDLRETDKKVNITRMSSEGLGKTGEE